MAEAAGRPWGRFPTTRWTLVLSARQGPDARRAALDALFAAYWKPVYFFLRRRGLPAAEAEDAVQGFFLHLLGHDFPARAEPGKGRFRSYLLKALDHFRINRHEHEAALKRGGGMVAVPLDAVLAERELEAAPEDPEEAFEREWALGVMERAVARLKAEYDEGRRGGRAEVVLAFFGLQAAPTYAEAAAQCGLTVPQFKAHLHRARVRFRGFVREEVAATVEDDAQVDAEMSHLVKALSA